MPRLSVWILRTALAYLGVGFSIGAYMLANKGANFDPGAWRLLFPHIEILLFGWTLQVALGVAFWIMPRLPGKQKYGRVLLAWLAYLSLNGGVLAVIIGGWVGTGWLVLVGRAGELAAALLFAFYLWPRVRALGGQQASGTA